MGLGETLRFTNDGVGVREIFSAIRRVWPHVRIEYRGRRGSFRQATEDANEFFLYRNFAAYRAINAWGVEEGLEGEFLHFRRDSIATTLVVGRMDAEARLIIRELESSGLKILSPSVAVA